MKITILDYGAGNLPSVERAFERLDIQTERATTPESISSAEAIVLPGVGHVAALIRALDTLNLREPLCEAVRRGTPFLGICLGLQVLFASSEEAPELPGLNLLEGAVRALPNSVKLPHMGWNQLQRTHESRLLRGLPDNAWFYFAHSYAAPGSNPAATATCTHGTQFAAVIEHENISAVQFHPEKSGPSGATVFKNFLEMAQCR
jgi:imidazole glycerol phosphate synthase glutamine amidotransferase subunit